MDLDLNEAIFTHIADHPSGTGEQTNIAVDRLREHLRGEWRQKKRKPQMVAISKSFVGYIRKNRGLEQHRLDRLTESSLRKDPIILAEWPGGTHLIVDGHHRYVRADELGHSAIWAFVCDQPTWRPFLVEGLPQTTKHQLLTGRSGL